MSWYRCLRIPTLVSLGVLLTGAAGQQSPPLGSALAPPNPLRANDDAIRALDRVLGTLGPWEARGIKVHLWQRVDLPGLAYQGEGDYLTGPGHRLRLDLKVQVGGTEGRLQVVSDGSTFWQIDQVGGGAAKGFRVDLQEVLDTLAAGPAAQLREEFYWNQSFVGLAPLLFSLREQMVFTRKDMVHARGRSLVRLVGFARRAEPIRPGFTPHQCRLYLDDQSLWPYRLEWWGPAPGRDDDVLLMQMEFRNPVSQPAPADTEFVVDLGSTTLEDYTPQWMAIARSRQPLVEAPPVRARSRGWRR